MSDVAVIAADLHLKKKPGLWSGRSEISGDDEWGLEQVAGLAISLEADLYLLGDTLDSVTNLPRPITMAQRYLGRVLDHPGDRSLYVRYIQGNHDAVADPAYAGDPWLSIVTGVTQVAEHVHGVRFDICGIPAYALDYLPGPFAAAHLATIPTDVTVLLLHNTVDAVMPIGFHFEADMIPSNVRQVFAGDYHKHSVVDLGSGRELVYPGSTYPCSTAELQQHVCLVVRADGDRLIWEAVPLSTRPFILYSDVRGTGINAIRDTVRAAMNKLPERMPPDVTVPVILIDDQVEVDDGGLPGLADLSHVYSTRQSEAAVELTLTTDTSDLTDAEVLSGYVDRDSYPDEYAFVLDVIEHPVEDALSRLRERMGIAV